MSLSQLSIFLENQPGRLLEVTGALSRAGIDIRAVSVADTRDFGILRLIVSDVQKAQTVLQEENCLVSITEVICVAISDQPGSLMNVIQMLPEGGINVEYMYAFLTISNHYAYVVLQVANQQEAEKLLDAAGVKMVSEEDITNL